MAIADMSGRHIVPEDMGIFRGFQIDYPEYTVVLPQTGMTYGVRSLNVSEVTKLKGSNATPTKATDIINRVLWGAIVNKPSDVRNYNDFLEMTTLIDREALMYALFITTFGETQEFKLGCNSCGTVFDLKFDYTEMFKITPFPGTDAMVNTYLIEKAGGVEPDAVMEVEVAKRRKKKNDDEKRDRHGIPEGVPIDDEVLDAMDAEAKAKEEKSASTAGRYEILYKEIPVTLPISKIVAVVIQPTLKDELRVMDSIAFGRREDATLIGEVSIIKRFEFKPKGANIDKQIVTGMDDIIAGYQSLPARDKKAIYDAFEENFSRYNIDISTEWICKNCGEKNRLNIDLSSQFFRMVIDW